MIKNKLNLNYEKTTTILDRFRAMLGGFRFKMIDGKGHYKGPGMDDYAPFCDGSGGGDSGYYDNMDYPDLEDDPLYRKSGKRSIETSHKNLIMLRDWKAGLVILSGVSNNSSYISNIKLLVNGEEVKNARIIDPPLINTVLPWSICYLLTDLKENDYIEITYDSTTSSLGLNAGVYFWSIEYKSEILSDKFELLEEKCETSYTLNDDYNAIIVMGIVDFKTTDGTMSDCNVLVNGLYKGYSNNDYYFSSVSRYNEEYNYMIIIYRSYQDCKKGDVIDMSFTTGKNPKHFMTIYGVK